MIRKVGQQAVDFELKDKDGNVVKLIDIDNNYVVVYFYPKDDTPGCTIEANDFTANLDRFKKLGVEVIGISGGNSESKKKFCDKYNLEITLLSDPDFEVSKKWGVYGEKSFLGKKFMGINRVTFILDREKKIIKVYGRVKVQGHAEEVLGFINGLSY